MKDNADDLSERLTPIAVSIVEHDTQVPSNRYPCRIDDQIRFNTEALEAYFFSEWRPVLYDALLVAASVEFCDRTYGRPSGEKSHWSRDFDIEVPVHDPDLWNSEPVRRSLRGALTVLTGDHWKLSFVKRRVSAQQPRQLSFKLPNDVLGVVPFSNGLDSLAVSGILQSQLHNGLVRVRLGSGSQRRDRAPFAQVPYAVRGGKKGFRETSGRSRGFKFSSIGAIAATLAGAGKIYVSESGQGALGPALATVGQALPDYRSHPRFTRSMEEYFEALLERPIYHEFPRLWHTKGETLRKYIELCPPGDEEWRETRSCWQGNRQVSIGRSWLPCGICAACMLRRLSVHGAGLSEKDGLYACDRLSAPRMEEAYSPLFDRRKITTAMREYALAGTLHLDHLAGLRRSAQDSRVVNRGVLEIAKACKLEIGEVQTQLDRMLHQHEIEWSSFLDSLGEQSFIAKWTVSSK